MSDPDSRRRRHRWMPMAVVAGAIAVYALAYLPILDASFIWDDAEYVLDNDTLRDGHGLYRMWFESGALPQYYPLVHTTFFVEFQLYGLHPLGYHLVNWVLHGLNAALVYHLLRRLGIERGAGLAALVFLIHPVHVESVAWITERKNVLSGLLYLGAFLAWLRFEAGGERARRFWLWSFALFVGALLSKSVTASLPAAILLVLWWRDGRISRPAVLALLPFFVVGVLAGLHTAWIEAFDLGGTGRGATGAEWSLSFAERLLVAGRSLWFYPGKILWPDPLVFIYPRWVLDPSDLVQWLWPATAILSLLLLLLGRRRLGRAPLTVFLFHTGTLLPALGFLNVYPFRYSFVADHFQYLASLGVIVWFAVNVQRYCRGIPEWLLAAILAIPLSILAHRHARVFEGLETLWSDTIAKNDTCWMAHNNLGALLLDRGDIAAATPHLRRALELKPDHQHAKLSLGIAAMQRRQFDRAHRLFGEVLDGAPEFSAAWANLGTLAAMQNNHDRAAECWRQALRLDPRYTPARLNLANLLEARGKRAAAVRLLELGIRVEPYSAPLHARLAELLGQQRRRMLEEK